MKETFLITGNKNIFSHINRSNLRVMCIENAYKFINKNKISTPPKLHPDGVPSPTLHSNKIYFCSSLFAYTPNFCFTNEPLRFISENLLQFL